MDENSFYGKLAKVPVYRLRQVLNFLQIKEYLVVTSDEYAIVKPGKNAEVLLNDGETVMMKLPKEQERVKNRKDLRRREGRQRWQPVPSRLRRRRRHSLTG